MEGARPQARLRQAVLVADRLEPVVEELRGALALDEPFRDPGVAEFGLTNAVFALGDCFLEVIAPAREGTAAGRELARRGAGGYMAIFDLQDLEGARSRAQALGIRVVWQIDLPDISGTHLHPADMRGAIVSLDRSNPYGSWRWGGPDWTGQAGRGADGRLTGIVVAVSDPGRVAARWAQVLGVPAPAAAEPSLELDRARVVFRAADGAAREGLCELELALPEGVRRGREVLDVAGVRLRLEAQD